MSILVLGTVALDTVQTPHGRREKMLGGSAVHFSMSARLFTDVHLAAIVGRDFPARHIDFLRRKGIILDSLIHSDGNTFHWEGAYEKDMNSALTRKTELGVLREFCPRIAVHQRGIKHVFLANVDPDVQQKLLACMYPPRLVGLDSMNYWIHTKRDSLLKLFKHVNIFVANDQEARDLSGEYNLVKAAQWLGKKGPEMVLIKKGEHGVLFYCSRFMVSLPAYPTHTVVDPTGAGDTFAGGFMGFLATQKRFSQQAVKQALAFGTIAASFNVEAFGTDKTSCLCMGDLKKRMRHFRQIILF